MAVGQNAKNHIKHQHLSRQPLSRKTQRSQTFKATNQPQMKQRRYSGSRSALFAFYPGTGSTRSETSASALRAVSDNPHDLATWWTLLLWPRRLAEDKDSRRLPRKTRNERLRAQITGEREPPKPEPYETTPNNHKDTLRRAVRKRVDAGQVNNAMKLIINDGKLLAPNVETLAALKDKHPPPSSTALPKLPDDIQTIAFDRESIELAIRSMNTASAA